MTQHLFKGFRWHEILFCVLPVFLVLFGGVIGGLMGALGVYANLKLWKSPRSYTEKVLFSLGITILSLIGYYILAILFVTISGR